MSSLSNRPTRSCNVKIRCPTLPKLNPVVLISLVYKLPAVRQECANDVAEIREAAQDFSQALKNLQTTTKALYVEEPDVCPYFSTKSTALTFGVVFQANRYPLWLFDLSGLHGIYKISTGKGVAVFR